MTFTNYGYPGTVDAVQWARLTNDLGSWLGTVESQAHYLVSINSAATRTVDVAAGTSLSGGVRTISDSVVSVALDNVVTAGATRWDAIVLRRDWASTGSVSIVKVNGTAALAAPQVIPSGVNNNPGVLHDQVLALAQITYGSTLPTAVVDMRFWASKVHTARTIAALPTPTLALFGTQVTLFDGSRARCALDSSNNPVWQTIGGAVTELTGTGVHAVAAGWSVTTSGAVALTTHAVLGDQFVDLDICLRRTGALLNVDSDGNVADTLLCTLKPPLFPIQIKDIALAYCTGTGFGWRQGLAEIGLTGQVRLLAGSPNADIPVGGNPDGISVRISISYARKV